jgi:hypothetical protein
MLSLSFSTDSTPGAFPSSITNLGFSRFPRTEGFRALFLSIRTSQSSARTSTECYVPVTCHKLFWHIAWDFDTVAMSHLREPSCFHVFGIAVNMSDSSRRFVAKQRYDSVKYAECFLDSTLLGQTKSSKKIKPRRRYEVRVNRHDSRSSERTID